MTPAISAAKRAKINFTVHEYAHDPASESYGKEAADRLGVPEGRVFKTLVVSLDNKTFVVGILPVSAMLSMKRIAKAAGAKKATMAAQAEAERVTGYILGGISPLGQKKRLQTIIDSSAQDYSTIYVSAGRRGLEIELNPQDLRMFTRALFAKLCQ